MTSLFNRVIPCLLLQDGGLVKTVRFRNSKYVGDPINAIRIFNDKYVDELVFLDIEASRKKLEPNYDLIERIAGECFMPLCYGGGIKSLAQAQKIVALGVEKIAISSAAIDNITLIKQLADGLGSQSVVGVIDVKRDLWGREFIYHSSCRFLTKLEPVAYAKALAIAGVGEIFINDVDRDGSYKGYDTKLIAKISAAIDVPVIACGGARNLDDLQAVFSAGASAAAAGSLFVFYGPHRAVLINYPDYSTVRKLFRGKSA